MYQKIMLIIFTIVFSSCDLLVITPMPQFEEYEYCPSIFHETEYQDHYRITCKCAMYNANTEMRTTPFEDAPLEKCEKAHAITLESFLGSYKPSRVEREEWYREETSRSDKRVKTFKKLKKRIQIK